MSIPGKFEVVPLTEEERGVSSRRGLVEMLSLITFVAGVVALISTVVNMPEKWADATVWQLLSFGGVAALCIVSLFNIVAMLELRQKAR